MLLLFDIDGTLLIKAYEAHREALHAAIREVHGVEIPAAPVDAAGRTDRAIVRDIARAAGVPPERVVEAEEDVQAAGCRHFDRLCPDDLTAFVAPGVPEVLADLGADDELVLSLVTGNYEPIARRKLAAAGIGDWFAAGHGGYGSDHHDRDELPAVARARAAAHAGLGEWPRERAVVIGDTPRDVACARADGIRVVGITTGPYAAEDLGDADAVVGAAHELPAALAALR